MLHSNNHSRQRTLIALALVLALCAAVMPPAGAAITTNTSLPLIASVQLNLPSAGQITINGTGFGSAYPPVTQSKSSSGVDEPLRLKNRTFHHVVAHVDDDNRGRIAFVSTRGGNSDIYVMHPDGSGLVNLTNHPANDRLPAWSPDGSKIAFRSTRDLNAEVCVMNDDGSDVVRLTNHPAVDTSPSWTSDGKVLLSSNRSGRFEIYVVNPDGTDLRHIDIAVDGQLTFPAQSRSGHRLAFVATTIDALAIWIAHPDGSHPKQLTADELVAAFPDWSPTGNRVIFSNNVCPVCDLSEIMVVNQGGNQLRQLTPSGDNFNDLFPRWSPDGSQIVVSRDDFISPTEIYIMNADGSGATNISNHPAFDFEADWGP
ncbi:MAG: TolB family protein [Pyrinomonadaceae bacterium]